METVLGPDDARGVYISARNNVLEQQGGRCHHSCAVERLAERAGVKPIKPMFMSDGVMLAQVCVGGSSECDLTRERAHIALCTFRGAKQDGATRPSLILR